MKSKKNFGTLRLMNPLADFLKRKKVVVMFVSGGVGEFLFQLDLAKRFEDQGLPTYFFIKKKYTFFSQIVQLSAVNEAKLFSLEKNAILGFIRFLMTCITSSVVVVNSFNSLRFSVSTKIAYTIALLTAGEVIISKKDKAYKGFLETVPYQEQEVIWERNNRIVTHITGRKSELPFPIVFNDTRRAVSVPYVHIHPVGSSKEKSYPVKMLIELFEGKRDVTWMFTLTPGEASWYVTQELRDYLEKNKHVTLLIKYFHASEIISIMTAATCFCTVNTGLLWLACMNSVKTVVIDTYTDFEWNPGGYKNVTRLSHDYDEQGRSLHLVKKQHEDGLYFESMYLVSPQEIVEAISRVV